jgi:hypothetical protein
MTADQKPKWEEFDDIHVQAWFNRRPFDRPKNIREVDIAIDAARWQFDQMKSELAAARAEISELKERLKQYE